MKTGWSLEGVATEGTCFHELHTRALYCIHYSLGWTEYSDAGVTGGSRHRKLVMQIRGHFSRARDAKEKERFLHKPKAEVLDPNGLVRVPE